MAERLRAAGFEMDMNEEGNPSRQRWRISDPPVKVDFLIEPDNPAAKPGRLFPLTKDWAAIIAPGLHLAFQNNTLVLLEGRTILGETAQRPVRVCGAGAFVVLKALAFHIRGENKDAYDLLYMLRNFGRGVSDVVEQFRPLLPDASAGKARRVLANRFPGCGGYWTEARCGIPIRTARTRTLRRMLRALFAGCLPNARCDERVRAIQGRSPYLEILTLIGAAVKNAFAPLSGACGASKVEIATCTTTCGAPAAAGQAPPLTKARECRAHHPGCAGQK